MSGDITDTVPIPDAAGIIPRVIHSLFDRLGGDSPVQPSPEAENHGEHSVKCSFIELYNEELRDLLSADDSTKLKIFDDANNKHGRTTTLVQGMEETHIKSASRGIRLLREGSHKRQVAATRCNDLSSRSHTVFTVTVYMKRTSETGEDYVCSGKLNLVDLAGSENIQRSGAENKRAAEAGLINKSLLTLGRVINALVDKGSHIPYRESKLTRLLQDSLGGRTKTCIIATLSPAKSNLEETISTLDYAFRAKNIRNKPQINQTVSKKTLLKEFTAEIEKLKSELIATRQRNGVYLTSETYEEITTESESRRILAEEQKDRIETMEGNLRNKVNELFNLTTNFHGLKRENEQTRVMLDGTKSVLERTEIVLFHTKTSLAEETEMRKAHERTEEELAAVGGKLLGTLGTTTGDVERLHAKLRRRSDLQAVNRGRWVESQGNVAETTVAVEERLESLKGQQEELLAALSERMTGFVTDELAELETSQAFLREKAVAFGSSEAEVNAQTGRAKNEMDEVLEEISTLRGDVKSKVGAGLNDLSAAAQRISAGIATELDGFHSQLEQSYVALGKEFKTIFEGLIKRMTDQQAEAERLRHHISEANTAFVSANHDSQHQLQLAVDAERATAATERQNLLATLTTLITDSAAAQDVRWSNHLDTASKRLKTNSDTYALATTSYDSAMSSWSTASRSLISDSLSARDTVKSHIRRDWTLAQSQTSQISQTAQTVHGEAVRIVDDQMHNMDEQLTALDDILSRVRNQTTEHAGAHSASIAKLAADVQHSYTALSSHFASATTRASTLNTDLPTHISTLTATLPTLSSTGPARQALADLRSTLHAAGLTEYTATGETPARTQYTYPTTLPRTETHTSLLNRLRGIIPSEDPTLHTSSNPRTASPAKRAPASPSKRSSPAKIPRSSPIKSSGAGSPSKTRVYADARPLSSSSGLGSTSGPFSSTPRPASLRELDVNVPATLSANSDAVDGKEGEEGVEGKPHSDAASFASLAPPQAPGLLKRLHTAPVDKLQSVAGTGGSGGGGGGGGGAGESKLPSLKRPLRATMPPGTAEGTENLGASFGPAGAGGGGRRLRKRGSD